MDNISNWQDKFEICSYAKKLIDKITHLNNIVKTSHVDILEVKKAIFYAKKYHGIQIRQSGELYYSHPIEVAYMVAEHTAQIPKYFRTDIIVTALLHDTIEDTELNEPTIACLFGAQVASQVEDLTRIKSYGKISAAEILSLLYKQQKYDLLLIKLMDRLHNMQTIGAKSPEKIQNIVNETFRYFISISMSRGIRELENMFTHLCYQYLLGSEFLLETTTIIQDQYQLPPVPVCENDVKQKRSLHLLAT